MHVLDVFMSSKQISNHPVPRFGALSARASMAQHVIGSQHKPVIPPQGGSGGFEVPVGDGFRSAAMTCIHRHVVTRNIDRSGNAVSEVERQPGTRGRGRQTP